MWHDDLTMRELWPEDPRWGVAYIEPPIWGVETPEYIARVQASVNSAKEIVAELDEKYPAISSKWWTAEFVERAPAAALLLQSVNRTLGFASMYSLIQLSERVAEANSVPFIDHDAPTEVQMARLALSTIIQSPDSREYGIAHAAMTEIDKLELVLLLNGQPKPHSVS